MGLVCVPSLVVLCLNRLLEVRRSCTWACRIDIFFSIFYAEFGYLLCSEALSRLNVVVGHPNALQPENVMAYDNAVSALGKICQFHRDSIDSAQVFVQFVICFIN